MWKRDATVPHTDFRKKKNKFHFYFKGFKPPSCIFCPKKGPTVKA